MSMSKRVEMVKPSVTLATTARAAELSAQGVDVVNLGAGEPDFPTPRAVIEASREFFEAGRVTYTAAAGIPELRDAVAAFYGRQFAHPLTRDEVVVTCGAKHALYLALQVLCNEGDEVAYANPYWVSYPEMAHLAGAVPVEVPTRSEDGFQIDPEVLRGVLTDKTRVLIVNSPSNPSGAVLDRANLEAIVEIAAQSGVWVVSDEIYDQLYYGESRPTGLMDLGPAAVQRGLVINGVSKTYGMTGWRIGYAMGPSHVIKLMTRVQSHETSNANTLAQRAALAALTMDQAVVAERRAEFDSRRMRMVELVRQVPGWDCPDPEGAFYVFPKVSALFGRQSGDVTISDSMALSRELLEKEGVATVAGTAFGAKEHLRLSYATSMDRIEEGLRRIDRFTRRLV